MFALFWTHHRDTPPYHQYIRYYGPDMTWGGIAVGVWLGVHLLRPIQYTRRTMAALFILASILFLWMRHGLQLEGGRVGLGAAKRPIIGSGAEGYPLWITERNSDGGWQSAEASPCDVVIGQLRLNKRTIHYRNKSRNESPALLPCLGSPFVYSAAVPNLDQKSRDALMARAHLRIRVNFPYDGVDAFYFLLAEPHAVDLQTPVYALRWDETGRAPDYDPNVFLVDAALLAEITQGEDAP